DELAPFQLIELHFGSRQPGPDCRISNWRGSVSRFHAELLNQSVNHALRTSWRRSGQTIMVSDNFLDQLIRHRLDESFKGASQHRQLVDVSVVAHERVFGF